MQQKELKNNTDDSDRVIVGKMKKKIHFVRNDDCKTLKNTL